MAKVGILTFHYADNYGAALQAYGLVKTIREMGHDVEVIDYRPLAARQMYGHIPRRPTHMVRSILHRWKFHHFRKAFLPLSRTYLSMGELKEFPPQVDHIVCGSDQIWNISSYRGFDPVFFGAHLNDSGLNPKRISYAATFGSAENLGDHHSRICDLLSRFDHISVRDGHSQRMVKDLIGRTAVHVLDPSFLTSYDSITPAPLMSGPYVFAHLLDRSEFIMQSIQMLRERFEMPIVFVGEMLKGERLQRVGPLQWLSLAKHAHFVITNSFHGTCFAIKNQKPFVMLPKEGGMSRLEDILLTANLENRLANNLIALKEVLDGNIDYGDASARIEEARDRSLGFLRSALEP